MSLGARYSVLRASQNPNRVIEMRGAAQALIRHRRTCRFRSGIGACGWGVIGVESGKRASKTGPRDFTGSADTCQPLFFVFPPLLTPLTIPISTPLNYIDNFVAPAIARKTAIEPYFHVGTFVCSVQEALLSNSKLTEPQGAKVACLFFCSFFYCFYFYFDQRHGSLLCIYSDQYPYIAMYNRHVLWRDMAAVIFVFFRVFFCFLFGSFLVSARYGRVPLKWGP